MVQMTGLTNKSNSNTSASGREERKTSNKKPMAPVKNVKAADINPWSWVSQVEPENVNITNILSAYRIEGFQKCLEPRRNCKRNPYCLWGLGEKKWKEDSEGDDDDEGAAFRGEGEYAGLQNLGATCYVNSLLQLWFHNPIFRPAILKWTPVLPSGENTYKYKPACPLAQLQAIFARMKISKRSKIDPSDFISSLLLNTGEQQDAQEFAKLFMDYIVKLLTDYGDDQIRKLIAQSFNGQLQYETECLGCKNKTRRSEGFTELNLGVKKNLNESLDELLADETLSDEYMCSNCHKKTTAKRRMQLLTLPPVLNLQLLRFVYDREAQRRKKVTQNISFPEVLEMQPRIHKKGDTNSALYKYHLTAVLIHNGQSASSGHYVAQIKDLRNGEWLKFNDEFVDPVNKGKSQKSKEDDSEDSEKKVKSKKAKNSPSLTSSGAYMLVYTLDKYIKNPEPDPELHQYLIDLVKHEDVTFEEEVNKSKNEKDFEISVKLRRRREVEWLYEFGKSKNASTSNGKRSSDSSDAENIGEPKPKIARYDDGSKEGPCDSTNSEDIKLNGNGNSVSDIPPKKIAYESDEIDFVSVDWISQWLDPGNPVPPVENGMLMCEHKKLAPPLPNSVPCLYRIVPSPLASSWFEVYQGAPRFRVNDLCEVCVKTQCKRLRALQELEEDFKKVTELVKKCDSEYASFSKSGESPPESFLQDKCWISKECMKNWKKMAKNIIDGSEGDKNNIEDKDEDTQDEHTATVGTPDSESPFNADLFCEHGNLNSDSNARKIIPEQAWTIIEKYFKDPITLQATLPGRCDECQSAQQASNAAVQQSKEIAVLQKAALSDLYGSRNRPDTDKLGDLYVVSTAFVAEWRRFVKDPSRYDPVRQVNNRTLICEHEKFMYPLQFVSEFLNGTEETDEMVCLLTPVEWDYIKDNFHCDTEIKVKVITLEKKDGIEYEPDICNTCAEQWLIRAFKMQFEYEDAPLYVIKKEKGDAVESEEEDSTKEMPIVTGKREVKPVNPDAWMSGFSNSNPVRRSARPRSAKGEKTYKVSSSLTIKELKGKICSDFKAMLSDQHLFYNGTELNDLAKSLAECCIPAKAKLYLEIDTAENGKADEPVSSVETGFRGTLLSGNPFGDEVRPSVQTSGGD